MPDPCRDSGSCGNENIQRVRQDRNGRLLIIQSLFIAESRELHAAASHLVLKHLRPTGLRFVMKFGLRVWWGGRSSSSGLHKQLQTQSSSRTSWELESCSKPGSRAKPQPGQSPAPMDLGTPQPLQVCLTYTYWATSSLTDSFKFYCSMKERKMSWSSSFLPRPNLAPSSTSTLLVSRAPNNVSFPPAPLCKLTLIPASCSYCLRSLVCQAEIW